MIGGDTLLWDNAAGQRQQIAIRDVSRIYLNPGSARTVFNYTGSQATAVATVGADAGGVQVRVDAKQAWTDTGVTVNVGDHVVFQASGQIAFGQQPGADRRVRTATRRSGARIIPIRRFRSARSSARSATARRSRSACRRSRSRCRRPAA